MLNAGRKGIAMDWVGIGLVALGLLWTAGFAFAHFRAVAKANAAESWPTAFATVESCDVVEEESTDRQGHTTTWYRAEVAYSYSVGGAQHRSRRLRFGNYRSASRRKAEAMLDRYRGMTTVPVRYNPDKPAESVIETVKPGPIYLVMAVFGLLFVGFGLFWRSIAGG
jgi:hypothetical protein